MKKFSILMTVTLTILSVSLVAQDTLKITTKPQNFTTGSKKEQMKMEVMKIQTWPGDTNISGISFGKSYRDIAKSKKEQMKMEVIKSDNSFFYPVAKNSKPAKCSICITKINRSKKEQMKMDVMKIQACPKH